jgi:hypothetical protein
MYAGDRRLNELGKTLCDDLESFFDDVSGDIKPSVLHGDLWSGNIAGVEGHPAIFDPATYYGEGSYGLTYGPPGAQHECCVLWYAWKLTALCLGVCSVPSANLMQESLAGLLGSCPYPNAEPAVAFCWSQCLC